MEGNGGLSEEDNMFWCCYYWPPEDSPSCSKNAKAIFNDPSGSA